MENNQQLQAITVQATVNAPLEKVWKYWNSPEHITQWNTAIEEWHCPRAENDLRAGGSFSYEMAAKDGSMSFDFAGVYDIVNENKHIAYTLGDGRKVSVTFTATANGTDVSETFDPENMNPAEMQQAGWQAILNNFKKYTENN